MSNFKTRTAFDPSIFSSASASWLFPLHATSIALRLVLTLSHLVWFASRGGKNGLSVPVG